jgi:hypothetical protein
MTVSKQEAARRAGIDPATVRAVYDFGDGRLCVVKAMPGDTIGPGEKIWVGGNDNKVEGATARASDGGDGSGVPHVPASVTQVQELAAREQAARDAAVAADTAPASTTPTDPAGSGVGVHVTQIEDDGRPENKGGAGQGDPATPTGPAAKGTPRKANG